MDDVKNVPRPPRKRRRLRRPRSDGMTAAELGKHIGVSARTVRYYVERRLIPSADFRGRSTVYVREHLLRLALIQHFREQHVELDAIRVRLDALTPAELEAQGAAALLRKDPLDGSDSVPSLSVNQEQLGSVVNTWIHYVLMPGVELHCRSDASVAAQQAAQDVRARFMSGRSL